MLQDIENQDEAKEKKGDEEEKKGNEGGGAMGRMLA